MYPPLRTVSFHNCFIYPDTDSHPGTDPPSDPPQNTLNSAHSFLWRSVFSPSCDSLHPYKAGCLWPGRCQWFCFRLSTWTAGLFLESSAGEVSASRWCRPLALPFPERRKQFFFLFTQKSQTLAVTFVEHTLTWTSNFARTFVGIMYSIVSYPDKYNNSLLHSTIAQQYSI